jgi:hypothetical protein
MGSLWFRLFDPVSVGTPDLSAYKRIHRVLRKYLRVTYLYINQMYACIIIAATVSIR